MRISWSYSPQSTESTQDIHVACPSPARTTRRHVHPLQTNEDTKVTCPIIMELNHPQQLQENM